MNPGTKLGHYEIVGTLGAGGMGEVYRASQSTLNREVAVKVLSPELGLNPERLRRFEQEARAASALNHPNIVSIYDVGREGGACFIAMELVEGRTLRAALEAGPMPIRRALQIAAQVADGLAKAHAAGIVHRDLKPENVMITRDGYAKILDFGLAKLAPATADPTDETLSHAAPGTNPGVVMGTVGYMSPEQARGKTVDFRSDIFSFGSVLYEMVTGKRPFKGESSAQTLAAIIEDDPQAVSELNPKAPAPLRWIIERCLAKEPEERYASTRDLARDLASLRDHLSESASAVGGIQARPRSPAAAWRRSWPAAIAGLVLGAVIGTMVTWNLAPQGAAPPTLRALTFSGADSQPAVSPDGRTVAFMSTRDGTPRIWLKQLPDGGEVPLTSGPDQFPRFSPDGSWILFTRAQGEKVSLYRVAAIGGEARKVVDDAAQGDFSPDGRQLVFTRAKFAGANANPATTVGVLNLQDGAEKQIYSFERAVTFPRWSPDGTQIALLPVGVGTSGGKRAVFLLSADGKRMREVESPYFGGLLLALAWSGDGRLLYSQGESQASLAGAASGGTEARIVLLDPASGKSRLLFSVPNFAAGLAIAAPGELILSGQELHTGLQEVTLGSAAFSRWLTHGASVDREPYYARDGQAVLFASTRSGDVDLWEVSTRNNSLRRITDNPAVDWDPFITPDNQHILFSSARSGNFEIWMAERDGSAPRQVSHDGYDAENPVETRDGWVIYISSNPQHSGLWKVREDGSQAALLVPGLVAWPDLSPDGTLALYHVFGINAIQFHVVRVADGKEVGTARVGARARFLSDGKAIAYLSVKNGGQLGFNPFAAQLLASPVGGPPNARPAVLYAGQADHPIETFAIAPDGKHAVLAVQENSASLVRATGVEGITPPRSR